MFELSNRIIKGCTPEEAAAIVAAISGFKEDRHLELPKAARQALSPERGA
jgi:hypothetical protein